MINVYLVYADAVLCDDFQARQGFVDDRGSYGIVAAEQTIELLMSAIKFMFMSASGNVSK